MLPTDFWIPVHRSSDSRLRIDGSLRRSTNETTGTPIRPWLRSTDCRQRSTIANRGEYFLSINGLVAHNSDHPETIDVDVSDMVLSIAGSHTLMGFCIAFGSSLSVSQDSLLYINGGLQDARRFMILNPTDATAHAYESTIAYAPVSPNGNLNAIARLIRTNVDGIEEEIFAPNCTSLLPLVLDMHETGLSTIPRGLMWSLLSIIRSNGATIEAGPGYFRISIPQGYEYLVNQLPDLHIGIYHPTAAEPTLVTNLVLTPRDYLGPSLISNRECELFLGAIPDIQPMTLSAFLIDKIGGIHFDYARHRIGFFDPL